MAMRHLIVVLVALAAVQDGEAGGDPTCRDTNRNCAAWARRGECSKNSRQWMRQNCPKSCGVCKTGPPSASCGRPQVTGNRVIAGDNAKRGSWPWQVLLKMNGRPGCGGSLISDQWVVTAAHCIKPRTSWTVVLGEHDRNAREGSEREVKVVKAVVHKGWNSRNLQNDIALLKLAQPVQFGKWISPVCLPNRDVAPGTDCYITGWGKINHPGNMHTYLQQAKMPVVSNSVCDAKNRPSIGIPVTSAMLCTGDGGRTKISGCHGDSGGPLVCKVNGKWELHGAVSHGSPRCSSKETYTVFARVTHFRTWIEGEMRK